MAKRSPRTTVPATCVSLHVGAHAEVFAGFPLLPGTESPRFSDDVWDFAVATPHANGRERLAVDFGQIEALGLRTAAKEFVYARLQKPVAPYRRVSVRTAYADAYTIRDAMLRFSIAYGVETLGQVTGPMVEEVRRRLDAEDTARSYDRFVGIIRTLHTFGPRLTVPLPFMPWAKRRPKRRVPDHTENTTPRIPEPVMGPYLQWALRYVNDFADEIVSALRSAYDTSNRQIVFIPGAPADTLHAYVQYLRDNKLGLPTHAGEGRWRGTVLAAAGYTDPGADLVNLKEIARHTGQWHKFLVRHADIIGEGYRELGADWQVARQHRPASLCAILGTGISGYTLSRLEQHLTAACYIVCAYLSGMRDSEAQSLERGCRMVERSEDGLKELLKVRGTLYKDRTYGPNTGEVTSWVVIEPVHRAIAVLEAMQDARQGHGGTYLFSSPYKMRASRPSTSTRPRDARNYRRPTLGGEQIGRMLNVFRDHVNDLAAREAAFNNERQAAGEALAESALPAVPQWQGEDWRFTTRQFRRTLAWYIVNRPFGTVAGMLQYKHARIEITEGYGGRSESGFLQEIEAEESLAEAPQLVALYNGWKAGEHLAGRRGDELNDIFTAVQTELDDFPGRAAVPEARIRAMLQHHKRRLHPGVLHDCHYDPAQAQCAKEAGTDPKDGPLLDVCNPVDCRNAILHPRHLPAWKAKEAEIDGRLRDVKLLPVLPANAVTTLEYERQRTRKVTAALEVSHAEN
jgi:integrase